MIVVNNAASGYVNALQHAMMGGRYQSADLNEMDYGAIARTMGCGGIRVEDPEARSIRRHRPAPVRRRCAARRFARAVAAYEADPVTGRDSQTRAGQDRRHPEGQGDVLQQKAMAARRNLSRYALRQTVASQGCRSRGKPGGR